MDKKRGRPRKPTNAKEVLEYGTLLAAETLVDILSKEDVTNSLKVDCAKEILNRVFGKSFSQEEANVNIIIAEELKKYCE